MGGYRHDVDVSYELRALASLYPVAAQAADEAGIAAVGLAQGYGLVPVTLQVFDRLGGGTVMPFGDIFWFLSSGVEAVNSQWAFNRALRTLGVIRGEEIDEFDAVNLGTHRHTEDWQITG
jgi:hypothetical protein